MTPLEKTLQKTGFLKLRAKHGKDRKLARSIPDLKTDNRYILSNMSEKGHTNKKDAQAHLWKKDREEKPGTLREIERKR